MNVDPYLRAVEACELAYEPRGACAADVRDIGLSGEWTAIRFQLTP